MKSGRRALGSEPAPAAASRNDLGSRYRDYRCLWARLKPPTPNWLLNARVAPLQPAWLLPPRAPPL
jgi:hypothetical protein